MQRVVPLPTTIVDPEETAISPNLVYNIFPEVASDSRRIDDPVAILKLLGVLYTRLPKVLTVSLIAVQNPLTPVNSAPDPTKADAVTTPVALI